MELPVGKCKSDDASSTPAGELRSLSSCGNIFGIVPLAAIMAIRIPTHRHVGLSW